jgi:hypothetical protein
MAETNFSKLAGDFDFSKLNKFGWGMPKDMPSFGSFSLTGSSDPYASIISKYGQPAFDPSKLTDKDAQSIYAMMQGSQPNINTLAATAELQRIGAQEANKMSRENLRLAEEAAIRQQGRDFTFGQAQNLISAIPRAFSPMPWDKNQEVVANIANIASPKNITAIPQVSPAGFSYTPTKYFR